MPGPCECRLVPVCPTAESVVVHPTHGRVSPVLHSDGRKAPRGTGEGGSGANDKGGEGRVGKEERVGRAGRGSSCSLETGRCLWS